MARPPLLIGTWGKINRVQRDSAWVAYARFRDFDGVTRQVERTAQTGRKAEDTLKQALLDRVAAYGADVNPESPMSAVAEQWFTDEVEGAKAYNTERRYREVLDLMVLPGLGAVRVREMTPARCDRFLVSVTKSRGPSAAKHARTVLSGVLGLATRRGALDTNPIRDVGRINIVKKEVEVLELADVQQMRTLLYADELAVARDIPNGVDAMLGTSARIGEALALRWVDLHGLDTEQPRISIGGTVIFVKGVGMVRQDFPKTSTSRREVYAPAFLARVLRERADDPNRHPVLVFPSARGKERDPNNFRKGWDEFKKANGYEWVHPHVFRKTAAALVKDPALAAGLLGHADERVTKTHYLPRVTLAPDVRAQLDPMGDSPADTQRNTRGVVPITAERRQPPGRSGVGQAG